MPDLEKKIVIPVGANTDEAETKVSNIIEEIKKPVKLEIDLDVKSIKSDLESVRKLIQSVIRTSSDGKIASLSISGMGKLQKQLEDVNNLLTEISNKISFDNIRPQRAVEADIAAINDQLEKLDSNADQLAKLQKYLTGAKGVSIAKSLFSGDDLKGLDNYITKAKQFVQLGGDLSSLQFGFRYQDAATGQTENIKQSVSKLLKDIGEEYEIDIGIDFSQSTMSAEQLRQKLDELNIELEKSKAKQDREFKVGLDTASLDAITEAVSKLNVVLDASEGATLGINTDDLNKIVDAIENISGSLKLADDATLGFRPEDIEAITNAFNGLKDVLTSIHNLLSSFDIPKLDINGENNSSVNSTASQINNIGEQASDSTREVNGLGESLSELAYKNPNLIYIFDGVEEKIFDVTKDTDALMQKLQEMADVMKLPAFHSRSVSAHQLGSPQSKKGDTYASIAKSGFWESNGNATYLTSMLGNIIDWTGAEGNNDKNRIIALDLSKYFNSLLNMTDDDELTRFGDEFAARINAFVAKMSKFGDKFDFSGVKDFDSINSINDLYSYVEEWLQKFNITQEQFDAFIKSEITRINRYKSFDNIVESPITKFQTDLLHRNGINAIRAAGMDSEAIGHSIINLDQQHPYDIDFGTNIEIAQKFYEMVIDKILAAKADVPNIDVESLIDDFVPESLRQIPGYLENLRNRLQAQADAAKSVSFEELNPDIGKPEEVSSRQKGDQTQKDSGATDNIAIDQKQIRDNINQALTEPFDILLNPVTEELRTTIGGIFETPFDIDITPEPSTSLRDAIDTLINGGGKYRIDVELGLNSGIDGKGQSMSQIMYDMLKADKFIDENKIVTGDLRERSFFFNSKTGEHSNPYIYDQPGEVRGSILKQLRDSVKGGADSEYHSHPEARAFLSIDNGYAGNYSGDFISMISDYAWNGIEKEIIGAQRDVQIFDIKKFFDDYGEHFGERLSDDTFIPIEGKIQNFMEKFHSLREGYEAEFKIQMGNVLSIIDQMDNSDLDWTSIHEIDELQYAFQELLGGYDNHTISQDFWNFVKDKSISNHDLMMMNDPRASVLEYLKNVSGRLQNVYDSAEVQQILRGAGNARFNIANAINDNLFNMLDDRENGDPAELIRRWASDKAFSRLGIKNFLKDYNQFVPIEEFKNMYPAIGDMASNMFSFNFDDIPEKIKSAINSGAPYPVDIEVSPDTNIGDSIRSMIEKEEPFKIKVEMVDETEKSPNGEDIPDGYSQSQIKNSENKIVKEEDVTSDAQEEIIQETSAFDKLKETLISEIPEAVDIKTQAFRSEQVEVDNLIDLEINKILELANTLQTAFQNIKTPESLKEFFDSINNVKITKNNLDSLDGLSKSLENLIIKMQGLNTDETFSSGAFSQINDLISHAQELKDLATVLSASEKEIKNATDTVNAPQPKTDSETAIENFKILAANASQYYHIMEKVQSGGVGSLTDKEYQQYTNFKLIFEQADAAAKKYNGTIDELTQAQDRFNKRYKEIENYQINNNSQRQQKAIDDQINTTSDRLAKISNYNKERWSSQYGDLKDAISNANESFRNTGDVDAYTTAVNKAFDAFNQFAKMPNGKPITEQTFGDIDEAKGYFESIVNGYKTVLKGVQGSTSLDSNGVAQWSATVRDAEGNVQKLTASWKSGINQMVMSSQQMPKQLVGISGVIDGVKNKIKELATYWTARLFDPMDIIRYSKQIFSIIQQYDDALTEMRKVSDESVSSLKRFQTESFSKANQVGTTALQLQQSTADWLRLGENFQEAQKSAQTSNILLNVSEFSNISDATEALTSASQAYKEFEKIDIVDKLNNIGNNFSVSTDQLAQGLQNAAAVLKTQGNDLDQALALLTSGNAITQDMSKTSAGIRTISLRISGTEEAKDEIKDMGEDVDDFVVRTKSKTDQIIRDYTAVAKNGFKGVSVLDDNGNLRSTYDILLDIAEVYEDIQKMDKEQGTNRAQALVETLAGKNRSNIAASILSNPQMLKDVYEMSQQSEGSAQEELDKYLDSISGKMQKLTNQLHELANITINSDSLKMMLDVVNALLSGVTSLAKQFGVINTIIGGVAGFAMQRKGLGKSRRKNALCIEHNNNAIMLLIQVR